MGYRQEKQSWGIQHHQPDCPPEPRGAVRLSHSSLRAPAPRPQIQPGNRPTAIGAPAPRDWRPPWTGEGSGLKSLLVLLSPRDSGQLLLFSERKHFPGKSTQAAALMSARKHLHPAWQLQAAWSSQRKQDTTQQPAQTSSDCPSHCQASLWVSDKSARNSSQPPPRHTSHQRPGCPPAAEPDHPARG